MDTTEISEPAFNGLVQSDFYLEKNLFTAMKKVKKVYADTICTRSVGIYCSNNELAYAQWLNGAVTKSPPKPMEPADDIPTLFNLHHYAPELSAFYKRMNLEMPDLTLDQVWQMMDDGYLQNMKFVGDLFLERFEENEEDQYHLLNEAFLKYMRGMSI
jgi:hypothetical protein